MISLDSIRRIEALAYPRSMRSMQTCTSWSDVADYCECSLRKLIVLGEEDRWYALIARKGKRGAEFVDLAKVPGTAKVDWGHLVDVLRSDGVTKVTLDAREFSSYRLILRYANALGVKVVSDVTWSWDGETMHEMKLSL